MSQICAQCGAPRTTAAASCPFCSALYGEAAPAGAPPAPMDAPPGVIEALDKGNLIEAIRVYRAATNSDLITAKTAVEKMKQLRGGR
jgi:ribosomal protein L7/L12